MALNTERLKGSIKAALKHEQSEELNSDTSLDRVSEKIATAVILEIKSMVITYDGGLVAPNGAVSGTLNITIG